MTDLLSTTVVDTTVRVYRPNLTSGGGKWITVENGVFRGLVRPNLVNILGRTVTEARLVGRVAPGWVAQNITLYLATEKWVEGKATWNKQPDVDTATAITVAVPAMPDGGLVEFLVTSHLQAVADGLPWYGWRIVTGSAAAGQRFYSSESGEPSWELHVALSDSPEQPTNLRPEGGAVSTGTPIVAWDFIDLGGESTAQAASLVEVVTPAVGVEPDESTAPDWSSGWVSNPDPQYDLAGSGYVSPGAGPTYWRVTVRDGDGNESDPSGWADFTVAPLPTLVIDSPTGPVGDPLVDVIAHLTGGTVDTWRVQVTGADREDIRVGSGWQGGAVEWTVPEKDKNKKRIIREDKPGWIYVQVYDTVDRAVAVGEKTYVDAWIPVEFTDSAIIAPTGLSVVPVADGDPRMVWSWSSTDTAPDAWLLQVDDQTVERVESDEITPNAGVYTWTDLGAIAPLRPHTLAVRAVRGKDRSTAAVVNDHRHEVVGVWLIPDHSGDPILLDGTAVSGFATSDYVATYQPLASVEPIDIVYGWLTRAGTFEGTVDDRQDVWAVVDAINSLRTRRNRLARLVWGSQSSLVRVKDPDVTPSDEILPTNLEHVVRFGFVEVSDV